MTTRAVVLPTFTPPLDSLKAALKVKQDRMREFKLTSVVLPVRGSASPLPFPNKPDVT